MTILSWPSGKMGELNPYVRLMYSAFPATTDVIEFTPLMPRIPEASVFFIHWPEGLFLGRFGRSRLIAQVKAWRVIRVARQIRGKGGIVVLTIHNTAPHIFLNGWQAALYERYLKRLHTAVDLLVGLSQYGVSSYKTIHKDLQETECAIIPHPHYKEVYEGVTDKPAARAMLGLRQGSPVFGLIGSMRESKKIPEAVALFRRIARENEVLLVSGECSDEHLWQSIAVQASDDPRVVLFRRKLSNVELATAMGALDVVIVNQSTMLNSGSVILGLSMNRPVLAPDVGAMSELASIVGNRWLKTISDMTNDAAVRQGLDFLLAAERNDVCSEIDVCAPEAMSSKLHDALTAMLRARPQNFR